MLRKLLENNSTVTIKDNIYSKSFNCGNGYYDCKIKQCICYPGWKNKYETCDFAYGNTTDIDMKNINNITTIPYFQNNKNSTLNIIFLFIIINICLIFILRYYYNKIKKKYEEEEEKSNDKEDTYMSEKDRREFEMNYINSICFSNIPNFNPSALVSPIKIYRKRENNNNKDDKNDSFEVSKKKYVDLISPTKKRMINEDDNEEENNESEDESEEINDIYKV